MELETHYTNGAKPFKRHGSNSFPYNVNEFQELLGINTLVEDDEEIYKFLNESRGEV